MFKDWKIILILALLAVVILLILFQPTKEPPDTSHAFKETIQKLEAQKSDLKARIDTLVKANQERARKDSVQLASQDKEIRLFKRKIAQLRPVVTEQVDSLPIVKEFIALQDSTIESLTAQNDTLKSNVEFQKKSFDDLVKIHINSERVSEEIQTANAARIQELEKLNEKTFKKMKRQTRLWKTVAVIGTVGALLAGSQL